MQFDIPDRANSLNSPFAHHDMLPDDLPNLRAANGRKLTETYRFRTRCWMPLAPIRLWRAAPEHYREDATPARVLAEHPRLRTLATAVASERYADDTATGEARHLEFLRWLYEHKLLGEHDLTYTIKVVEDDAG